MRKEPGRVGGSQGQLQGARETAGTHAHDMSKRESLEAVGGTSQDLLAKTVTSLPEGCQLIKPLLYYVNQHSKIPAQGQL